MKHASSSFQWNDKKDGAAVRKKPNWCEVFDHPAACQKLSPECDLRTRFFILPTESLCQHTFKIFTM